MYKTWNEIKRKLIKKNKSARSGMMVKKRYKETWIIAEKRKNFEYCGVFVAFLVQINPELLGCQRT